MKYKKHKKIGNQLDFLWTPWRMKYIQERHDYEGCVFCRAAEEHDDQKNLIFYRGEHVFLILNRYPYTSGHVMCVPYDHKARLQDLTQAARWEMMDMVNRCIEILQMLYQPDGFNVGLNLGEMAGAGVAEHLHAHIVPRWSGDTNFMSSIGDTRVLPEDLETSYQRIKAAWEKYD